jgi:hypothetical protein
VLLDFDECRGVRAEKLCEELAGTVARVLLLRYIDGGSAPNRYGSSRIACGSHADIVGEIKGDHERIDTMVATLVELRMYAEM